MHRKVGDPAQFVVYHVNDEWKRSPMPCSIPASDHMHEQKHMTKCDRVCAKFAPWNLPTNTRQG